MNKKRDYRGLSLIRGNGDPMAASPQPRPPVFHVERAGYVADVLVSQWEEGEIFHYVIQPLGSREITHWGQETSLQRAKDCVEDFLKELEKRKA